MKQYHLKCWDLDEKPRIWGAEAGCSSLLRPDTRNQTRGTITSQPSTGVATPVRARAASPWLPPVPPGVRSLDRWVRRGQLKSRRGSVRWHRIHASREAQVEPGCAAGHSGLVGSLRGLRAAVTSEGPSAGERQHPEGTRRPRRGVQSRNGDRCARASHPRAAVLSPAGWEQRESPLLGHRDAPGRAATPRARQGRGGGQGPVLRARTRPGARCCFLGGSASTPPAAT